LSTAWRAPLGWRRAIIFAGSQAAGGLYLALVVAPNHQGMPV
jgi:hypothetical protein